MEQYFHDARQGELLRLKVLTKDVSTVMSSLHTERMSRVMKRIERMTGHTVDPDEIMNGTCAVVRITDRRDDSVTFELDHRYMGGVTFLRAFEATLGLPERRILPTQTNLVCFYHLVVHLWTIVLFMARPRTISTHEKTFATKRYAITRMHETPRRMQVYHAFVMDALAAFGRDQITVGFTVPFEHDVRTNNVGLILVDVTIGTSVTDFRRHFTKRMGTAIATNALSTLGSYIPCMRNGAVQMRERIDVICTTFVSSNSPELELRAGGKVYEGAYAFLHSITSEQDDETRVIASVTTNRDFRGWTATGFVVV